MAETALLVLFISALLAIIITINIRCKHRLIALNEFREPFDIDAFATALPSGIPKWVVEYLLHEIESLACAPISFRPTDKPLTDYDIDEEDFEDVIAGFAKRAGVDKALREPLLLPVNPTLTELIIYCNELRNRTH